MPPTPQGSEPRRVAPLPWPSACPRSCAQLPCLPFVERGEEGGDVGGRGRLPGILRALYVSPCARRRVISVGPQDSGTGSQVGYYGHHYYHPHLHFTQMKQQSVGGPGLEARSVGFSSSPVRDQMWDLGGALLLPLPSSSGFPWEATAAFRV